ncbi:hypothetical protein KJ603_01045 [Patescibacteria group bacterium]|nr:hypothetical protein [Patescibacteria group bacterium]
MDNPPEDMLHSDFISLQNTYNTLMTKKVLFYQGLKGIITYPDVIHLIKMKSGKIVYFKGEYSQAGYPKLYYFRPWSIPFMGVTTNLAGGFEGISSKDFVHSLMNGIGFDKK